MKLYILFHDQCYDGFGAAYAAWKKFGDEAHYIPCSYGKPIQEVSIGSEVYMIDFSLSRQEMINLYHRCNGKLVVLDHHKTAQKELEGLDFATFDMNKSGAMLSWEYFHPKTPVPSLIKYIQDRDLWKNELVFTKEVSAALASYPKKFETWDRLDISRLATEGVGILRYQNQLVEMICEKAKVEQIDQYKVAVVNATSHWSDVGNYLLNKFPECDYSASYYIEGKQKKWSLRSRSNFDVSVIAKFKGGGGHKNAAGYVENIGE